MSCHVIHTLCFIQIANIDINNTSYTSYHSASPSSSGSPSISGQKPSTSPWSGSASSPLGCIPNALSVWTASQKTASALVAAEFEDSVSSVAGEGVTRTVGVELFEIGEGTTGNREGCWM